MKIYKASRFDTIKYFSISEDGEISRIDELVYCWEISDYQEIEMITKDINSCIKAGWLTFFYEPKAKSGLIELKLANTNEPAKYYKSLKDAVMDGFFDGLYGYEGDPFYCKNKTPFQICRYGLNFEYAEKEFSNHYMPSISHFKNGKFRGSTISGLVHLFWNDLSEEEKVEINKMGEN